MGKSLLLSLPPELINAILSHLSPYDLTNVSATCKSLRIHALSDVLWQSIIQQNVNGACVENPGPCPSFHRLYASLDRLWFLPRYKIWFCDRDLVGKLIVIRYDPRRACIEGYQLLATTTRSDFQPWPEYNDAVVHSFDPTVKLHLDKPVLRFRSELEPEDYGFSNRPGANRFADEMPMELDDRLRAMFSNFSLARPIPQELVDDWISDRTKSLWPPPQIPAQSRVAGPVDLPEGVGLHPFDHPHCRSEVSENTFRIRKWMEMNGAPALFGVGGALAELTRLPTGLLPPGSTLPGIRIGEEIVTYATLDPDIYTPTPTRPWRGIWVGDYSGHGCEFLVIHQPDEPAATDAELGLFRDDEETDESWEKRRQDAHIYRGRLEAIKLTGDPNIPRGEQSFIVNDLGPDGFVGISDEAPFKGTRMVHSLGHVANTGFVDGKLI